MKKVSSLVVFITILFSFSSAYSSNAKENLITQADNFAGLINQKKYKDAVFKMHPIIVIRMGGFKATANAIKESFSTLDSGHNTFKGMTFNSPDAIVKMHDGLAAIVRYHNKIEIKKELYQFDSFYIAWSSDEGKKWYFADGSGFSGPESLEFLFPNYNNELILPMAKRPYKLSPTQI